MKHRDYVARREAQDPESRTARKTLEPEFEFRKALITARTNAGLTQAELAARAGTKQPAIARLERGETRPSYDMLQRLSTALNVSCAITPGGIEVHEYVATE